MKYKLLILSLFVSLVSYSQVQSFLHVRNDSMFAVWVINGDSAFKHLPVGTPIPIALTGFVIDTTRNNLYNRIQTLIADNSTEAGRNLLNISTPASSSVPVLLSNGNVTTRNTSDFKSDLALDQVNNTTDLSKPLSTAAINANALKANINSPAFTGTPTGIGIPVYARVTGSNATTTGQALVDIAGLSIPLATNAIYEISGMLSVSTSNVTTGVQYGLNYSVAGGTVEAQLSGSLTSTATKTERISTLNTASTAYLTTSNGTGGIIIRGIITTGANAGNLTVKFLKVTSGTATVFQNSVLKVTRIQ